LVYYKGGLRDKEPQGCSSFLHASLEVDEKSWLPGDTRAIRRYVHQGRL